VYEILFRFFQIWHFSRTMSKGLLFYRTQCMRTYYARWFNSTAPALAASWVKKWAKQVVAIFRRKMQIFHRIQNVRSAIVPSSWALMSL